MQRFFSFFEPPRISTRQYSRSGHNDFNIEAAARVGPSNTLPGFAHAFVFLIPQ
jgi:hypothetical protein